MNRSKEGKKSRGEVRGGGGDSREEINVMRPR